MKAIRTLDPPYLAMGVSLAVALLMLVGKMTAFWITGSNAILSDAAESVVHLLATSFATFSLWYSRQAPDQLHPYGHGKIAFFSAGFEGALIGVAALGVFYLAIHSLIVGVVLGALGVGLLITFILAVINALLGTFLVMVGRRYHSLVLIANGKNVLADMWTSFGVVLGVGLVWLTGWKWLDPVVAIVVAIHISVTAFSLLKSASQGLLDQACPENTALLQECLDAYVDSGYIKNYHQLRHRQAESTIWIEFHALLHHALSLEEAHERITIVESAIRQLFPDRQLYITSHLEPSDHEEAHPEGYDEGVDAFNPDDARE
jgi:cation diffusion facilitator family transporter